MANEFPNEPDPPRIARNRHDLGFPPIIHDPSRVRAGLSSVDEVTAFPADAVDGLTRDLAAMDELNVRACSPSDLRAVLAWIATYVPRPVGVSEEIGEVDGISILSLSGGKVIDGLDMIRANGRAFVPEVPAIEVPLPEDLLDRTWAGLDHLLGNTRAISREQLADAMADAALGSLKCFMGSEEDAEEDHNPDGFVHASPEVQSVIAGATQRALSIGLALISLARVDAHAAAVLGVVRREIDEPGTAEEAVRVAIADAIANGTLARPYPISSGGPICDQCGGDGEKPAGSTCGKCGGSGELAPAATVEASS